MAKIVAIVNQKGGVGKTTTCVNLAAAVAQTGKRVLLCDFDPQANATSGMGVDKTVSNGVYDVIINGVETEKAIVSTPYGDVLPSSKALAGAGVEMIALPERQFLLKQALRQVAERYDFIFAECAVRRQFPAGAGAGRVFRAGGTQRPDEHGAAGAPGHEPRLTDRGRAADHV